MTTQDMHQEHSDVDTSVVEYSSASEKSADTATTDTGTSTESQDDANSSSSEPASPVLTADEVAQDQPSPSDAAVAPELPSSEEEDRSPSAAAPETMPTEASAEPHEVALTPEAEIPVSVSELNESDEPQQIPAPHEIPLPEEATQDASEQVAQSEEPAPVAETSESIAANKPTTEGSTGPQADEVLHSVQETSDRLTVNTLDPVIARSRTETETPQVLDTREEEVRPFTDFIEEFRQAEAARLQSTSPEDTLALLNAVKEVLTPSTGEPATSPTESGSPETVAEQLTASQTASTTEKGQEKPVKPEKTERAVSPLLRPATRLRVPRHTARQQREEQAAAAAAEAAAQQQKETSETPAPAEAPETAPPPKPARRYRFDRPAASANGNIGRGSTSTSVPSPSTDEETRSASLSPILEAPVETVATKPAVPETPAAQEEPINTPVAPETSPSPAVSPSSGRRKHAQKEQQQQQKEQQIAAQNMAPAPQEQTPPAVLVPPLASDVAPGQEVATAPGEIAPEDLPPLEYSELRKASSRRRRRRSSSTPAPVSNTPGIPALPTPTPLPPQPPLALPPVQPVQPVVPSAPPQRPAASTQQAGYSIVSGYTLNQMNLGSEITSGPFMGPEPSPARGSLLSRDGRTIPRSETQRTTGQSGTAHNRSGENGFSSAAISQLSNAMTQAFQLQTDRMVTELRRFTQSPTNVTVSLPPFPSTERVGVFVDVANLLYSARTLRIAVDFGKLLDFLRGNRRLVRAHAYCPTSPQPGDEQMFLQAVKGLGYRITTKNYKTFSSGAKKADLDLDLCMDVVRLVEGKAVDCIVLVSGDSDFMPMLDYCSDHGVRVEVAAFDEAMSATLRQSCDLFINLSLLEEIRA